MNKLLAACLTIVCILLAVREPAAAGQQIVAVKVSGAPAIDGRGDDPEWRRSRPCVTRDAVSGLDITLRAVYAGDRIFFLVQYADQDESRAQKPWIWNRDLEMYEVGPQREDTFVFKWSMSGNQIDLSIRSDEEYTADIWYWKACRTDPAGYADDKNQSQTFTRTPKTRQVTTRSGKSAFLKRRGDYGESAYRPMVYLNYHGDTIGQFQNRQPTGSRSDIQARGLWANHQWTIEFSRKLKTGHDDDIQFETSGRFLFGVSRYEIAGRMPDPMLQTPDFGSGDISEPLLLVFEK